MRNYTSARTGYVNLILVGVIAASITIPILNHLYEMQRYKLGDQAGLLVGGTSPILSKKITFDKATQLYQFNKDGVTKAAASSNLSTGSGMGNGSKLYAADIYKNGSKGITLYDTVNNTQFGFAPLFKTNDAEQSGNHFVLPLSNQTPRLVYTAKANGIKEDILLSAAPSTDTAQFSYKLNLPAGLEARLLTNGGVGIYGADPSLLGNITTANGVDQATLNTARQQAKKTTLAFYIPAPIVTQAGGKPSQLKAKFSLTGTTLTVSASGLKTASYPLSIDPSVVVTSSSNFATGSFDNIDLDTTNNQLVRGSLTGGSLGSWATGANTKFTPARFGAAVASYNGYIYVIGGCIDTTYFISGGCSSSNTLTDISYASVTGGTIGNYASTTALTSKRLFLSAVAYNGFLYVIDGQPVGTNNSGLNAVQYVNINTDGSLGATWHTANSTNGSLFWRSAAVYNGYIYVSGGRSSASTPNTEYAQIRPDGSLGSWVNGATMNVARGGGGLAEFGGYLYATGGNSNSGTINNSVEYAKIKSDGSITAWTTTVSFTTTRFLHASFTLGGYLYIAGGCTGSTTGLDCSGVASDTQYAPLYSDGTIGKWMVAPSINSARWIFGATTTNGYAYYAGGCTNTTCGTMSNDTYGGSTLSAGSLGSTNASGAGATFANTLPFSGAGIAAAVDNGFLYVAGGQTGTSSYNNHIYHTKLNRDGTFSYPGNGSNGNCTAVSTVWCDDGVYTGASIVAGYAGSSMMIQNHCLFLMGGVNGSGTTGNVYVGNIFFSGSGNQQPDNDGQVSSVIASTHAPAARAYAALTYNYNAFNYVGGINGSTYRNDAQYSVYDTFTCGATSLGNWNAAFTMSTGRAYLSSYYENRHFHFIGGYSAAGNSLLSSEEDFDLTGGTSSLTNHSGALDTARAGMGAATYNGQLYLVGGTTDNSSNPLDTHTKRLIIGDGSSPAAANWKDISEPASPLPSGGLNRNAVVAANGFLYSLGGCTAGAANAACTGFTNAIYYSSINNGGDGGIVGATSSIALTTNRKASYTNADNGYVYALGGCSVNVCGSSGTPSSNSATVSYTKLNSDGSLFDCTGTGKFCDLNSVGNGVLPECRTGGDAIAKGNYLYYFGGYETDCTTGVSTLTILYAYIDPTTGALSQPSGCTLHNAATSTVWCDAATSLPANFSAVHVNSYGNYFYVSKSGLDIGYLAVDPSTGALSTPSGCGTVFASSLVCDSGINDGANAAPIVIYGNRLYQVGGQYPHDSFVTSSAINNDGSLGVTRKESSPSFTRWESGAVAANGYLYSMGGYDSNDVMVDCYGGGMRAPIMADGSLGQWQYDSSIGFNFVGDGKPLAIGPKIYYFGAFCGSPVAFNNTFIISPRTMGRSGSYSQTVDFGADLATTRELINYAVGASNTYLAAAFQVENTAGAVGTKTSFSPTSNSPTATVPNITGALARYFTSYFNFDDIQSATFPDTTQTTVSDYDLRYHAATPQRLLHGKTFTTEVLRSQDTEGP